MYQTYIPDPVTGALKRVQKYLGVTDSLIAERRKKDLDQKYDKVRRGHSRRHPTLKTQMEEHLKQRKEQVALGAISPHTLRTEIGILRLFLREMESEYGQILLKSISKDHIDSYAKKGKMEGFLHGRGKVGRPVSDATIAIHLRHLKSFFEKSKPWINANPVVGISIPSVSRRASTSIPMGHTWTDLSDHLESVIRTDPTDIPTYLVLALVKTGMRIGELMRLKWYPTESFEQTTGHARSYSILSTDFARISVQSKRQSRTPLVSHISWVFEQLKPFSDQTSEYVFTNPDTGKVFTYKTFADRLSRASFKIGLSKALTPHALRHGFITEMIRKSKGDLAFVGKYVGHRNEWMTEHYSHVIESQERSFIELIH